MSENPYKGVPGGDPRLRAQHVKSLVSISYICVKCNKEKSEVFPEGKDLTGRTCVDCRNAESIIKQKAQDEAARKRWAAREREREARPIRTNEEMFALLKDWENAPKHQCDSCGKTYFVADPAMPFITDHFERPNAILTVSYRNNPFDYEIHGEENPHWYCDSCHQASSWEI